MKSLLLAASQRALSSLDRRADEQKRARGAYPPPPPLGASGVVGKPAAAGARPKRLASRSMPSLLPAGQAGGTKGGGSAAGTAGGAPPPLPDGSFLGAVLSRPRTRDGQMASAGSLGLSPRAFEKALGGGAFDDGRSHTGALIRSIRYPNAPSPMPILGAMVKLSHAGTGGAGGGGGAAGVRSSPSPTTVLAGARQQTTSPRPPPDGNPLNNYLFRQTTSPRKLPADTPVVGRPSSLLHAVGGGSAASSAASLNASDAPPVAAGAAGDLPYAPPHGQPDHPARRVVVHNAFGAEDGTGGAPGVTPPLLRGATPSGVHDVTVTSR